MASEIVHSCDKFLELNPKPHTAGSALRAKYGYGLALTKEIYRNEYGSFTMGNGEYAVNVLSCPYCGLDLRAADWLIAFNCIRMTPAGDVVILV